MNVSNFKIDFKIKYPRLLVWMNIIPVMLGFKPFVPNWCIYMSKPYMVVK